MIPSNNSTTATAVIEGVANMAITKNDDADPGNDGESNMYTIGVTNNGPGNASEDTLTDSLPEGAPDFSLCGPGKLHRHDDGCVQLGELGFWKLGDCDHFDHDAPR
jgi:uncharacterized repeat protein (TIGR01451 family)